LDNVRTERQRLESEAQIRLRGLLTVNGQTSFEPAGNVCKGNVRPFAHADGGAILWRVRVERMQLKVVYIMKIY
jgi:hypothetical protein